MTRVWVADEALSVIFAEASEHMPLESGGLLLGYWNHGEVVVVEATVPSEGSVRDRWRYRPDPEHDEELIRDRFVKSDGAVTYLGDWHSHPHGFLHPSWKDRQTLERIASTEEASCPRPLMFIAYRDDKLRGWQLSGWTPVRRRLFFLSVASVERLELEHFDAPDGNESARREAQDHD